VQDLHYRSQTMDPSTTPSNEVAEPLPPPVQPGPSTNGFLRFLSNGLVPIVAVFLGLAVGAIFILLQHKSPIDAGKAIYNGAFNGREAFGRTLEKATPLVLSGLAIIVALKAGLFNIGAQGQLVTGAVLSAYIGFRFHGLPTAVHVPFALAVGGLAGAVPAAFAGFLKAKRSVHEVITTIMLNSIIVGIADWLASRPWKSKTAAFSKTADVLPSAVIGRVGKLPLGFGIAIIAALILWVVISKTTFGFRLATVGGNRNAAHYAGVNVSWTMISAMAFSGMLAGFGGAIETLGVLGHYEQGTSSSLGFDGITIALLAKLSPRATIPSALLIAAMRAADTKLQTDAGLDPDIVSVVVAVILLFVAAPVLLRWLTKRFTGDDVQGLRLTSGWGS
jgi:general nucleoside transport system permease protein